MGEPLDRSDVQAIILTPYGCPASAHLLFGFDDAEGGRAFLRGVLPMVTRGCDLPVAGREPLLNVGLSWTGLVALRAFEDVGGPEAVKDDFYVFALDPDPESLRLSNASGRSTWWHGAFASKDIHATVHVHASDGEAVDEAVRRTRRLAVLSGVRELMPGRGGCAINGRAIEGRKLHFGYEDGISHPQVNWDDEAGRPELIPRDQFLLGHETQASPATPAQRAYQATVRNGSFMAFTWMYQDVARFNRFLKEEAPRLAPHLTPADAEEWLAAKMMGRWRDGTPLALSPERPDPALREANDFGYADDPDGLRCPLSAHVRIANGRDQPLNGRNRAIFPEGFPRVLRRGTPYGPPLEGVKDDCRDRGTVGLFICANLNRQFYSLTRWLGRTNFSDLDADPVGQDPVSADRSFPGASNAFAIPTRGGVRTVSGLPDFVRMQGVAFLLLPGLQALRTLAGSADAPPKMVEGEAVGAGT